MLVESSINIRRIIVFPLLISFLISCNANKNLQEKPDQHKNQISVLAWNIWHGANNTGLKEDGRPHAINIIKELSPDIVLMVETYGSGKMIADSLGYNFHLIAPKNTPEDAKNINLSIMSKFPLGKRFDFYRHFNIGGIEVILNDSTVAYVDRFYNRTIHYVTAASATGTATYTLGVEGTDEGPAGSGAGAVDVR